MVEKKVRQCLQRGHGQTVTPTKQLSALFKKPSSMNLTNQSRGESVRMAERKTLTVALVQELLRARIRHLQMIIITKLGGFWKYF